MNQINSTLTWWLTYDYTAVVKFDCEKSNFTSKQLTDAVFESLQFYIAICRSPSYVRTAEFPVIRKIFEVSVA